jgi:hypothetical protein
VEDEEQQTAEWIVSQFDVLVIKLDEKISRKGAKAQRRRKGVES